MTSGTARGVCCAALLCLSFAAASDDSSGAAATSSSADTKAAAKAAVRHPGSSTQTQGGVGPSTRAALPPDAGAVRSPGAPQRVAGAPKGLDELQAAALERVNYYRKLAGLPPVAAEPRLALVAQAHSSYLDSANEMGHYEDKKSNPFYTGNSPFDRIDFSGYDYAEAGEVVARQHSSHPVAAVDALMTAVYHRFIILSVDFVHAGPGAVLQAHGGAEELNVTVDFGAETLPPVPPHSALTVYPALGQTGVPTDFDPAEELPSPMPGHSLVGYPISIQVDARRKLTVQSFELYQTAPVASPQALEAKLLTHAVDAETPAHAAALIPVSPLAPAAIYKAVFSGSVDGTAVSTSWEFMTAPETRVTMSFALPKVPPGGVQRVTLDGLDVEKGPYYLCYAPARLVKSLVHETETQIAVTTGTDCDPGASCQVSFSASYHSCAKPFAGGTFTVVEEGN
jgi:uncharacterized protein YkwD